MELARVGVLENEDRTVGLDQRVVATVEDAQPSKAAGHFRGIHPVGADLEIAHHVGRAMHHHEHIVAALPPEHVRAGAAIEPIGPRATLELVIASAAVEPIAAATAQEPV